MPSPIEQALTSLLPTRSYLPPELLSLSTSLLAQSRTKASTLKPEEEIARTYACCHIACQRLGHKLALEIAKPAPPVKPKVYNKLHAYLNAVLKTTTATPRTPTARRTEDRLQQTSTGQPARSAAATPTKDEQSVSRSKKRPASQAAQNDDSTTIPTHAKDLIRLVCHSCNSASSIPHVFAGLSSILSHLSTAKRHRKLSPSSTAPPTSIEPSQLPTLIIAIFTVVYNRVKGAWNVDDPVVAEKAGRALRVYETGDVAAKFAYDENLEMMEEVALFKAFVREGWGGSEWLENVPGPDDMDAVGLEEDGGEREEVARPAKTPITRMEKQGDGVGEVGAAGLLPGLGTMFQPAVDWLSVERTEEFGRWRRKVLGESRVVG